MGDGRAGVQRRGGDRADRGRSGRGSYDRGGVVAAASSLLGGRGVRESRPPRRRAMCFGGSAWRSRRKMKTVCMSLRYIGSKASYCLGEVLQLPQRLKTALSARL